jgi:hypothetical protein
LVRQLLLLRRRQIGLEGFLHLPQNTEDFT